MSTVNGFQVGSETLKYNYESLDNYNTPNFSTSSSTTYTVGDYVMYNGKLYKCTTAITGGTWVSSSWTEAVLSDDVNDLTRQLNDETTGLDTKAPVILETASGAIASFSDGADSMPIRKIVATIEPLQSGTGDPSPDNVRPISGCAGANIFATGKNMMDCVQANKLGSDVTVVNGVLTAPTHNTTEAGIVFPVKPNTTYVVGFTQTTNANIYIRCAEYISKPTSYNSYVREILHEGTTQGTGAKVRTITTGNEAKYVFFGFYRSYNTPQVIADSWFANLAGAGTMYEPYTGETLPINWESEAGTVYGGTVTLNADGSADLVSEWQYALLKNLSWNYYSTSAYFRTDVLNNATPGTNNVNNNVVKSSAYKTLSANGWDAAGSINVSTGSRICIMDRDYTTVSDFISAMGETQIIYKLKTPQTYHFDNIGQLKTFLGVNNVWADTGDITELVYPADTKLFLTARDEEITGNIAPIENGTTASKAYAQGAYFWHDTKFCKALTAIASGATFTSGTNYTETTVAAELLAAQN